MASMDGGEMPVMIVYYGAVPGRVNRQPGDPPPCRGWYGRDSRGQPRSCEGGSGRATHAFADRLICPGRGKHPPATRGGGRVFIDHGVGLSSVLFRSVRKFLTGSTSKSDKVKGSLRRDDRAFNSVAVSSAGAKISSVDSCAPLIRMR